MNMILQYFIQ